MIRGLADLNSEGREKDVKNQSERIRERERERQRDGESETESD